VHRRLVLALALLLAPVAGCLGGDGTDAATDGTGEDTAEDDTEGLRVPGWSLGDHWTYRTGDGEEQTWAVTRDAGSDWIVDTDSRDAAFFDARSDVSFFGERRKADLAGSQGDANVRFFDWPLVEDKTWTTTWDGVEREITVDRIEDGTAYLTARQNDRVAVEYTYDSEAGNFGTYTFLDKNGREVFTAELAASGADYGGTLVRWDLTTALERAGGFGAEPESFGFGFDVPENATDIWLAMAIDCPSGSYDFGFEPSGETGEGSSYGASDTCPAEADVTGPVVEDPAPGEYRGGFTGTSPEAEGTYSFTVYVRTLVEITVGDG